MSTDDASQFPKVSEGNSKKWVSFEEEEQEKMDKEMSKVAPKVPLPVTNEDADDEYHGAIINPETVHVNLDRSLSRSVSPEKLPEPPKRKVIKPSPSEASEYSGTVMGSESVHLNIDKTSYSRVSAEEADKRSSVPATKANSTEVTLRTVDLRDVSNGTHAASNRGPSINSAIIRQGFANGDIIVTLLPVNTKWPWITPAKFRPELVPEELMAQGLTLTVEDYVHVMEILTNDFRFNIYNICYKRILVAWIFTAFVVLLGLLFSGVTGLTLFGLGVMWLILNALAIFFCMWVKIRLNHNLERCMAQVNKHLLKHRIILGLDDRGKLSCHKVNLCFIYFDAVDCIKKLQEVIEREEREGRPVNREETVEERRQRQQFQLRMDIEDHDIIIQGSNTTRVSRKQERAEMVFLRYSHRWAKEFVRKHLELSVDGAGHGGFPSAPPRHCITSRCPCQFIEEHLKYKPRDYPCSICALMVDRQFEFNY
ncbi:transmembrane protein 268 isoform X1 [Schistocerca americana]|uniref:transmembrane protein 268 isoform X1 n=1 Tax=Schistocerca americana TaxID=7009 RepID=UPI001F500ED3|nr:transmembrane protein 268 isoform X1 [Schistocerca americana]XP_049962629.1 transmembrane protein 268 isoform X2 [Schistocerca serialis cubense]